jgi:molybdopterin-guanine dinucleotide biosynthesis protein A
MPRSNPASDVTGVVIAGGRSSRMDHREKALLDLAGEPMIGRIIERLRSQVGRMVINANGDPERFASLRLPVVADSMEGYAGPLAGLQAGLDWARRETPDARFIASVAADTPFIPGDLVARLRAALEDAGASSAIAASGGAWTPVVGIWSLALADTLAEALREGVRAVHRFAAAQRSAVVDFPLVEIGGEPIDPFFNVNTPDDLARARALLAAHDAGETARG